MLKSDPPVTAAVSIGGRKRPLTGQLSPAQDAPAYMIGSPDYPEASGREGGGGGCYPYRVTTRHLG